MKTKYVSLILFFAVFSYNQLNAGCGSCAADKNRTSKAFIEMVPSNGKVDGKTFASCGMCNFDYKGIRGCSLTIKIGETVYPVQGNTLHEHGDPHSEEGMCNVIRVAYVSGKIKEDKFYSDSFALIESPK